MNSISNSFIKASQMEYSYSTKLPNSTGAKKWRVALGKDNQLKISTISSFVGFIDFLQNILSFFGIQKRWVKVSILDPDTDKKSAILVNVNSLFNRTILKREEILAKSPDELSEILSNPEDILCKSKKLNDHFKDVILINLDSRPDRIQSLTEHLMSIGQGDFSYTRQSAVLGKNLDPQEIARMSKSDYAKRAGKDDRHGRLGVLMSHLEAVQTAKKMNYPNVLILEDDARFMPDAFSGNFVEKAMNDLPKDWGVVFWGCYDAEKNKAQPYSEHLVKPGCPYDAHAWMINSSSYDLIIDLFETELKKENGQMRACDVVIGEELSKKCPVFAAKQNLIIQDEGFSSIVAHHVAGNYGKELRELKRKIPSPFVQGNTADGFPVMEPLLAGTLYQMMHHADRILNKHGITYWIEGGTCLGAERNGSLIPWDDDLDVCIAPGMEEKFSSPELKKDLSEAGLQLEPHWLGFKIFAKKEHPLGKTHFKDECHFKTPSLDVFITKKEKHKDEDVYFYGTERARKVWDTFYKHSEVFEESGKIRRVNFGPIKVNGLVKPVDFCKRNYGSSCFEEAYMMYDHLNEVAIERVPVRMTDFRSPAYHYWDGLKEIDFANLG